MTELVTLADCPPGPFRFGGTLGFKTEYGMVLSDSPANIPGDQMRWKVTNWPDAYCMENGETFWGGASTHEERAALMVEPINVVAVDTPLTTLEELTKAHRD